MKKCIVLAASLLFLAGACDRGDASSCTDCKCDSGCCSSGKCQDNGCDCNCAKG
jgi:hypothetical protein